MGIFMELSLETSALGKASWGVGAAWCGFYRYCLPCWKLYVVEPEAAKGYRLVREAVLFESSTRDWISQDAPPCEETVELELKQYCTVDEAENARSFRRNL